MGRALLSFLGLGAAAGLTATGGVVAGGIAAGLAANITTDAYKCLNRRLAERFIDGWSGIDENHHVNRGLRLAQINGLRSILQTFDNSRATDPNEVRQREANRFSGETKEFLDRETKAAQGMGFSTAAGITADEQKIRLAVLAKLPDAFDTGLAVRRAAKDQTAITESLQQLREALEAGVLEEIRLQTLTHGEDFPPGFVNIFEGKHSQNGWFDLFIRDAAAKIKEGEDFEKIWNAEQVALIKADVKQIGIVLGDVDKRTESMAKDLADLKAVLLATGRDPNLAKELEVERNKYKMTVEAVIKELGRVDSDSITPDSLISHLSAVFTQYLAVKEALARPANDVPAIRRLKERAIAALDSGNLDEAENLLNEVLQHERREAEDRRSDWLAALLRQAESYAMLGRIALARRNLADAVQKFQSGANELAPADSETRWSYTLKAADALQYFGDAAGVNNALTAAISLYRAALKDAPRDRVPLDWAKTQNNLGNALRALGAREAGTARLEEAVAAYRAALREYTQDRLPLDWAMTQNNLGNALATLGERESDTARLEEAVAAYRAALREYTQDRVPLDWAMTQNNLGNALWRLGEREAGTARLEEAVAAYRSAQREYTQDSAPLAWATTQNNLGSALGTIGERESDTARLEEAVAAYRAALQERTQDRAPLAWAMTQNNLGTALATLGERESGTARLEEAVAAFRAALREYTQDRAPLAWAMTQNNLGTALGTLGSREAGTARLEEAVAAFRAALREYTQDRVPLDWAMTQNNLGAALRTLGEREAGTSRLEEAVAALRAALQERTQDRVPPAWAATQYSLANALAELAGRRKSAPQMSEALACMKNAMDGFTQCGDNYRLPIAQARVTKIQSALAALQT